MINGLICSEDVLYFLIVIALFVVLTILRLRFNRKKGSQALRVGWYTFVVGSAMFLGYLSSRPVFMCYYDTTAMKSRTLTSNSQAVMEKMDGGLTITTYVNLLDDNYWDALPRNVNNDFKRFKQYINGGFKCFVLLHRSCIFNHKHHSFKILFFRWCFVYKI